jgi:hypothetical protein
MPRRALLGFGLPSTISIRHAVRFNRSSSSPHSSLSCPHHMAKLSRMGSPLGSRHKGQSQPPFGGRRCWIGFHCRRQASSDLFDAGMIVRFEGTNNPNGAAAVVRCGKTSALGDRPCFCPIVFLTRMHQYTCIAARCILVTLGVFRICHFPYSWAKSWQSQLITPQSLYSLQRVQFFDAPNKLRNGSK